VRRRARVIAGKSVGEGAMQRSVAHLRTLAAHAQSLGLRLMTENWYELLATPQAVHHLFGELNGDIGLCLDFGNWSGGHKYDHLANIAPLTESCHTKANFFDGQLIDTRRLCTLPRHHA
jgi:sugar phosphate isomerase/epimerase